MKARAAVLRMTGSAVCALVFPSLASADPIAITAGTLVASDLVARLDARANDFRMIAVGEFTGGIFTPWSQCLTGCAPGSPIDLFGRWSGSDFEGSVTINGGTFPLGISTSENYSTEVFFMGSVLAPAFDGRTTAEVSAPFSFSARLFPPQGDGQTRDLVGRGTATLELTRTLESAGWVFNQAVYTFEPFTPVPEPGTMTLIGLGLAGMICRQRRRHETRIRQSREGRSA